MRELKSFDGLQPMDQGFLHGRGPLQKAIEAAEGAWPCHAFTVLNKTQVFEALEGGMTLSPLESYRSTWNNGNVRLFRPDGSLAAKIAARNAFYKLGAGKPYAYPELIGFLPVLWFRRLFKRDIPNPLPLGWVCSEANCRGLRLLSTALGGTKEWDARNALEPVWLVNPNDVDPGAHLEFCATGDYPKVMRL